MNTTLSLVKTDNREYGIAKAIDLLDQNPVKGKSVLLKPNFNTADPYPGSTHNDTLRYLVQDLKKMGATGITVADRSGPADTAGVLREKDVPALCAELGVGLINFEDLPAGGWVRVKPEKSHWRNGFDIARPVLEAECIVTTCCLKTHGYGGVFTISLKLSVGMTHKRNMAELHTSVRSMRKMIAEINQAYIPSLIILDAMEAFVDGGPMTGKRNKTDLIIAATDRIAIDAAGIAVLKMTGSNKAIMDRKIFEQEQISRAIELGLGISGPEEIEIVTDDKTSNDYARQLVQILNEG